MDKSATRPRIPTCFISYSWDSNSHKTWVRNLAAKLQDHGVATTLDQWDVRPGSDFIHYMERSIRESEFVLLICTPPFREKSDDRRGGVGYEGSIITAELFSRTHNETKFVPILRTGDEITALPSYLRSRACIDFRNAASLNESFEELLRHLHNQPKYKKPPLGSPPSFTTLEPANVQRKRQRPEEKGSETAEFSRNVFLNTSFDRERLPLLKAQVFTVIGCGFVPRCALEIADSSSTRLDRLFALMASSKYAIHDITPYLQTGSSIPTLNMPFELGIWLGLQRTDRRVRRALILEDNKYQSLRYLSDLAGFDVQPHGNDDSNVIGIVRQWLATESDKVLPASQMMQKQYKTFTEELPMICRVAKLSEEELSFHDYTSLVSSWLSQAWG